MAKTKVKTKVRVGDFLHDNKPKENIIVKKLAKKKAPTARQIKAAKAISENLRNKGKPKTLGKILKDAGYSKSVQESPTNVTESLGFKELIDKYLPEDMVTKVHGESLLLGKHSTYRVDARLSDKEVEKIVESVSGCKLIKLERHKGDNWATAHYWEPDGTNRLKAIDMAYKLRNNYPKDKEEGDTNVAIRDYLDKLAKILP
jgi:hypothetical protein